MTIYKVQVQHMEIYEIIVKASDRATAIDLAAMVFYEDKPVDSYWYDSDILDEWNDDDPLAPEVFIEEKEE